jgi:hypothetical protein
MSEDDIDWLVEQIRRRHRKVGPWEFDYEYPGFFVYYHTKKKDLSIYFTPDWEGDEDKDTIAIQVTKDGEVLETARIPFKNRTPRNLFNAVVPWLEKYSKQAWGPREWSPRD